MLFQFFIYHSSTWLFVYNLRFIFYTMIGGDLILCTKCKLTWQVFIGTQILTVIGSMPDRNSIHYRRKLITMRRLCKSSSTNKWLCCCRPVELLPSKSPLQVCSSPFTLELNNCTDLGFAKSSVTYYYYMYNFLNRLWLVLIIIPRQKEMLSIILWKY